jgi:hypothetical protein
MKAKDPTISVGVDLAYASTTYNIADDTWDPIVLADAKYDFVEMHYYPERNNVDDDHALLTTWADQVAANFSATRSLLAQSGHPNTPIFFGEFDRDNLPGHETLSIVDALFIAIVLGESTNAGALMDAVWIGTENCHPDSESSPVSTAYGWQNFGGWGLFAADGSGFSDSCADKGVPKGTPFPKERSFELFHRHIVPGEKPITMTSMDSAVRAYGATHGTGYSVFLINTDSNNIHKITLNLQNSARSSFSATALTYGKAEYDLSAKGNWAPPSPSTIGSVGTTFQVSLPVWSVTLVSLQ